MQHLYMGKISSAASVLRLYLIWFGLITTDLWSVCVALGHFAWVQDMGNVGGM